MSQITSDANDRVGFIGGSDDVMDVRNWVPLWRRVTGRAPKETGQRRWNDLRDRGHRFEAPILEDFWAWWKEIYDDYEVWRVIDKERLTFTDPDYPWRGAHVDMIVGVETEAGVMEHVVDAKKCAVRYDAERDDDDENSYGPHMSRILPVKVRYQMHHYYSIVKKHRPDLDPLAYLSVDHFGRAKIIECPIEKDVLAMQLEAQKRFWSWVEADIEPPPQTVGQIYDRWRPEPEKSHDLDAATYTYLRQYVEFASQESAAKEAKKEILAQLLMVTKDAGVLKWQGYKVASVSNIESERIKADLVTARLEEILAASMRGDKELIRQLCTDINGLCSSSGFARVFPTKRRSE